MTEPAPDFQDELCDGPCCPDDVVPCTPIPCPPFETVDLKVTERFDWISGTWIPVES